MYSVYFEEVECSKCVPTVDEFNVELVSIYSLVCGQHIIGFGGAVALSLPALLSVLDMYEMDNQNKRYAVELIMYAYNTVLQSKNNNGQQLDDYLAIRNLDYA